MQLGDKTRPGLLPQLRAPETAEADKLWVGTKRFAVVMPGCNIGGGTTLREKRFVTALRLRFQGKISRKGKRIHCDHNGFCFG